MKLCRLLQNHKVHNLNLSLKTRVKVILNFIICLSFIVCSFFMTSSSYADVVFKSSFVIGAGQFQEQNFTEIHLGGSLHLMELPLSFDLHGFQRLIRDVEDFYGLDLQMKLKRQFKMSNTYFIGTYFGPGYRFATNDLDAPLLDFSMVFSKSKSFSIHLGYKLILLDWAGSDLANDSLIYLGFQI